MGTRNDTFLPNIISRQVKAFLTNYKNSLGLGMVAFIMKQGILILFLN